MCCLQNHLGRKVFFGFCFMKYDAVQLYWSGVRVDNHSRIVSLNMGILNEKY